jgi:multidrug efflux pump subunit AcrA (membrane-fusion protein)
LISKSAVIAEGSKSFVYKVENDISKKTFIKNGIESGGMIEVLEGLKTGDKIIVQGQDYLYDGEEVLIIQW